MRNQLGIVVVCLGILAGCNREAKVLQNIESFNAFQLKLAMDQYEQDFVASKGKKFLPSPDDIDHAAQSVMGACKGKPYEADFKVVYDAVIAFQREATQPRPDRKKVEDAFAEVKSKLQQFDAKHGKPMPK